MCWQKKLELELSKRGAASQGVRGFQRQKGQEGKLSSRISKMNEF